MSRFTTEELLLIAHGLSHYDQSNGNLPLFRLPIYTCDNPSKWISEVGYRDVREVFEELAKLRPLASGPVVAATTVSRPELKQWRKTASETT